MALTRDGVSRLVQEQLDSIRDSAVKEGLIRILVLPEQHLRDWDYGTPGEQFPCWTVAVHEGSGISLVYSEHGFGPKAPWGLVGTTTLWFGMDSGWFLQLRDCFLDSPAATELSIWQVVKDDGLSTVELIQTNLPWDGAWKLQKMLMKSSDGALFHVRSRPDTAAGTPSSP